MCSKSVRCVVIESNHLSAQNLSNIGQSMSEVVLLATNRLSINKSLTHLSIHLLDTNVIQLVPLLAIDSKLFSDKYFQCLTNLSKFMPQLSRKQFDGNTDVNQNIELILRQIKESVDNYRQFDAIDITFISGRLVDPILRDLCPVLNRIDTTFLSMINIVCIKSNQSFVAQPFICGPSGTVGLSFKIPEELESMIESQTIVDNKNSMDGYFRVWLHDLSPETETIRICLNGDNNSDQNLIIKCNLKEAVIDFKDILIAKNGFSLNSSPFKSLANIFDTNCCYDLEIVSLVRKEGLCDSVIYGTPFVLSESRSPNLTYDELIDNWHRFNALIETMNEKEVIIISKLKLSQQMTQKFSPNGFYALLPSPDRKAMIMKSIATKEQLLPHFYDSTDNLMPKTTSEPIITSIRHHLNRYSVDDIYNPLGFNSNLFQFLSAGVQNHTNS